MCFNIRQAVFGYCCINFLRAGVRTYIWEELGGVPGSEPASARFKVSIEHIWGFGKAPMCLIGLIAHRGLCATFTAVPVYCNSTGSLLNAATDQGSPCCFRKAAFHAYTVEFSSTKPAWNNKSAYLAWG